MGPGDHACKQVPVLRHGEAARRGVSATRPFCRRRATAWMRLWRTMAS